jgi:putative transposase
MPWKETCVTDEKIAFVAECLRGELPMTALCEDFGISRDTGYRLLQRYREEGANGLMPRSRAPHRHGMAMAEEIAAAIIALRCERPCWGPKKLRKVLMGRDPKRPWPALSTIGDLLRREGLSAPRRRRRTAVPRSQPFLPVCEPNDLWCIDFKGWFRTADGRRCDPLTITDVVSDMFPVAHTTMLFGVGCVFFARVISPGVAPSPRPSPRRGEGDVWRGQSNAA